MILPRFKRTGIFFIPQNIAGWIILLAGFVFTVHRFLVIDSHSHSASDTLMNFFFNLLIIGAVYTLIAFIANNITDG